MVLEEKIQEEAGLLWAKMAKQKTGQCSVGRVAYVGGSPLWTSRCPIKEVCKRIRFRD